MLCVDCTKLWYVAVVSVINFLLHPAYPNKYPPVPQKANNTTQHLKNPGHYKMSDETEEPIKHLSGKDRI